MGTIGSGDSGSLRNSQEGPRGRQLAIAEAVIRNGSAKVDELVTMTGVSPMTIYRDLSVLEDSGVLTRHRGGVVAVASGLHEADAEFRVEQSAEEKHVIAQEACRLVGPGSSVMLDDSSSAIWLLRALPDPGSLTVVTNSLLVADEVSVYKGAKLVVTGGEYQAWAHALMGPVAVRTIRSMHADLCFVSASGIFELGCYHPYQEVVEVKRAMIESAEKRVLLMDHTKFNRRALFKFAELLEFDHVIVDSGVPTVMLSQLRETGVQVVVAGDDPLN